MAYGALSLNAKNLPLKLGGGNVGKHVDNIADDVSAVDEGQRRISRAMDGNLIIAKVPSPFATSVS